MLHNLGRMKREIFSPLLLPNQCKRKWTIADKWWIRRWFLCGKRKVNGIGESWWAIWKFETNSFSLVTVLRGIPAEIPSNYMQTWTFTSIRNLHLFYSLYTHQILTRSYLAKECTHRSTPYFAPFFTHCFEDSRCNRDNRSRKFDSGNKIKGKLHFCLYLRRSYTPT